MVAVYSRATFASDRDQQSTAACLQLLLLLFENNRQPLDAIDSVDYSALPVASVAAAAAAATDRRPLCNSGRHVRPPIVVLVGIVVVLVGCVAD